MTKQIKTAIVEQNPTRWQKLLAWLTAFDQAMNYDPQANNDTTIRHLKEGVARLETKVTALEGSDQHTA